MKTTVPERINILGWINASLDIVDEKISELGRNSNRSYPKWNTGKKTQEKWTENDTSELWDTFKQPTKCVTGVPRGEDRRGIWKSIWRNNGLKIFQNLWKL